MELEIFDTYCSLKVKTVINRVSPIKGIVLVVHVAFLKPNVMQKLDGINIIT